MHFFCRLEGPAGFGFCFSSFNPNLSLPIVYIILGSVSALFLYDECTDFRRELTSSSNLIHSELLAFGQFTLSFLPSLFKFASLLGGFGLSFGLLSIFFDLNFPTLLFLPSSFSFLFIWKLTQFAIRHSGFNLPC